MNLKRQKSVILHRVWVGSSYIGKAAVTVKYEHTLKVEEKIRQATYRISAERTESFSQRSLEPTLADLSRHIMASLVVLDH